MDRSRALASLNLRDLATAGDGTLSISVGHVFRSGHLASTTSDQRAALDTLDLRTIVDLRGTEERERTGLGYLPPDARRVLLPIRSARLGRRFREALRTGKGGIRPDTLARITAALTDAAAPQMGTLLRLVADSRNHPILFHCTHGKDRTGFAAALLLSALGASFDQILADYLRTNETPHHKSAEQAERIVFITRILGLTPLHAPRPGDVARLFSVQSENLVAAWDRMERRWGGAAGYLDFLGMTDTRRSDLKRLLLHAEEPGS